MAGSVSVNKLIFAWDFTALRIVEVSVIAGSAKQGFTYVHIFLLQITAAGLAQSVERLTEEREVAGSILGAGPIFRVLK